MPWKRRPWRPGAAEKPAPPPAELCALLHQHNVKEEDFLYPMLDSALDAQAADAVVYRFQAMDPPR